MVVRKSDDFEESFPEIENFIGELDFGLSSSGDAVRLYNSELILQDEVYYESEAPWPDLSNGLGYTLELIDPSYDNSLAESWSNINFSGSLICPILKQHPWKILKFLNPRFIQILFLNTLHHNYSKQY